MTSAENFRNQGHEGAHRAGPFSTMAEMNSPM